MEMAYLNGPSSFPGEGSLCRTYWLNLNDSREAVITIHKLNGNQPACPAEGCWDLKVFSGDRVAGAQEDMYKKHYITPT